MTDDERDKWDDRYASGDYQPRTWPSPFLENWIPELPIGRALVLACGVGRNAIRLAEAGFRVEGVDISPVAISRAEAEASRRDLDVEWRVADLDGIDLEPSAYDLITVIRYRSRSLWPRLPGALAPDGFLLVEHHLQTALDVAGPPSPGFRLEPQELLDEFSGACRIVHYSEVLEPGDEAGSMYALARMVACNGSPGF